ncbi:MAG: DUF3501 family protein, partial [Alphaproteobacteria bacterium]
GKASSVQFAHFEMTAAQAVAVKVEGARIIVGVDHANYAHMAVMSEATRKSLASDLD